MITELSLSSFKCFDSLRLPLTNLTLLSGANASGKSSILQSLVLLHQTMVEHEWSTRLMLNGETLRLGTVFDVVDQAHGRKTFEVGLVSEDRSCRWFFSALDRSDMSLVVDRIKIGENDYAAPAKLHYLLPDKEDLRVSTLAQRLRNLVYLSAERIGPRDVYPLEDRQTATVVGPKGEHVASLMYWGLDERVLDELVIADHLTFRFHQIAARMKTFFPGCVLAVERVPNTNALTLGFKTSEDTNFHRPIHEGFGLTQVLPIVVAALSVGKGDLLLIENPEVHLHPSGQGRMGQFLAEVASAGVQVVVETHSDHVLNGIRRAVKGNRLVPEQVSLYFFNPRSDQKNQVSNPQLDKYGNIDSWPEGFFDQFDKDMNHFAGWGD
ncbi:MAG: DUF3696 domain-containing protein [Magnetococcales bacterium]|nr:DUF3696 domain-containing protein [Magnetococcales bacterium]